MARSLRQNAGAIAALGVFTLAIATNVVRATRVPLGAASLAALATTLLLAAVGFATGVGAVPASQPRDLSGDEHYYTDGLRAVLFFSTRPLTLADVKLLDWEPLPGTTRAAKEADGAPH